MTAIEEEPLFIRPQDAAKLLSISSATVHRLLDSGEIPSVVIGKRKRIPAKQFQRYVDDRLADALYAQKERREVPVARLLRTAKV